MDTSSTIFGVLISLAASCIDAIGINLQRLDHVRNLQKPLHLQSNECVRPVWHLGFSLYVCSQLFGSSAALRMFIPKMILIHWFNLNLIYLLLHHKFYYGIDSTIVALSVYCEIDLILIQKWVASGIN